MTEPDAPISYVHIEPNWTNHQKGLTKREYFAALIAASLRFDVESNARWAVRQADALIEALNENSDALNEDKK